MGGAILEMAVLSEIMKTLVQPGKEPQIPFWMTLTGVQVDIVFDGSRKLIPMEVKLSATRRPAMAEHIMSFQKDFGDVAGPNCVIHPGDVKLPLSSGVTTIPFAALRRHFR